MPTKYTFNLCAIFFLLVGTAPTVFSQSVSQKSPEVIAASGGHGANAGINIDWTLGELAITTLAETNRKWTQGFHQGNYVVFTSLNSPDQQALLAVFPNPTNGWLSVSAETVSTGTLSLYHPDGRCVLRQPWTPGGSTLDFSLLPPGTYLLRLHSQDGRYYTTRIQKF